MHGMNRAKTVYYDGKGNMIKNTNYKDKSKLIKSEIEPGSIVSKKGMKLVNLTWLNRGLTFWFADENGRQYPMTDSVFMNYLENNPIEFGDMDIQFLQRGSVYSIGFVRREMIIKKEFILDEDDIKYAIRDYLAYDVEDTDKLSVDLKAEQTPGVVGFVVSAVCTEKTEDA